MVDTRLDYRGSKITHLFRVTNDMARSRLVKGISNLEKQKLYNAYDDVFTEWQAEGVVERVPDEELDVPAHFLLHHSVVESQGTTIIRPVFDASASEKGFSSLNKCLAKGPNLIEIIPSSLNRFREGEIGVFLTFVRRFCRFQLVNAIAIPYGSFGCRITR